MNITQSLVDIGLNEKQAELYTYLLKQPKGSDQTAFIIAQKTALPRSTVYVLLEELESKKLVSSYKKNNVLHYLTANPSRLAKDLEEKQDILKSLLPTLENLSKDSAFSSSVRTFTGEKGIRIVFDDIYDDPHLKGIREFYTISHPRLLKYLSKSGYFAKKMEQKRKYNLHTKMIAPDLASTPLSKEYASDSHRETRYLTTPLAFEGTLIVYGKKTALFSHKDNEVYSIIVDSPAITEMFEGIFLCLWDLLPKATNK
ncbi:MAG: helix-turn-helix domain-containing protein [Patescibacteria group bacterium]